MMSTALARRNPNGDALLGIIYMQIASSVQGTRTIGHFQKYQWLIRVGLKPWILKRESSSSKPIKLNCLTSNTTVPRTNKTFAS